jgi:diguanylate cyclase (GGDEF)-like protein
MRLTTATARAERPESQSSAWVAVVVACALAAIFVIDSRTDRAPVQHLYYLPIILAGTMFTMRGGILAALSAVILYHVANPHLLSWHYGESDAVQVALFLAVGIVTAKLTSDNRRLHHLATTDDLTGLHNLRSFETALSRMVRTADHEGSPVSLLVADLDHLKSLNDQYGHLTGAESVRTVGEIIGRRIPPDAVACRYGGDEFAIAVANCGQVRAQRIAGDLCGAIRRCAPTWRAGRSGGDADHQHRRGVDAASRQARRPFPKDYAVEGEALFKQADRALYDAKSGGRDRVSVA